MTGWRVISSGSWHPMAPVRVEMTIELARAFGVFSVAGVSVEPPGLAADGHLEMVHLQRYIAAVRQAGDPEPDPSVLDFGLGTEDNPVFAGMHDASALVAGATLAAARKVWGGQAGHGASIADGLHHAMRASASGFCAYKRPGDRDQLAARRRREPGGLRRYRRAPRGRGAGRLL